MRQSGNQAKYSAAEMNSVRFVKFGTFSKEELEAWSVAEITETRLYDGQRPVTGSPNDLRLGVSSLNQKCETCGESRDCQGHFGHIKLNVPVFHYGFLKYVQKILKCVCHKCFRLKILQTSQQTERFKKIIKITNPSKRLTELSKLFGNIFSCDSQKEDEEGQNEQTNSNISKGCGAKLPQRIQIKSYRICVKAQKKDKKDMIYTAEMVKKILQGINPVEANILGFKTSKPVDLLIETVAVAPPQIRPSIEMNPEKRAEDDITSAYVKIISINNEIKTEGVTAQRVEDLEHLIASIMIKLERLRLQAAAATTVSLDANARKKNALRSVKKCISQRLKGKEGRFRQNLMGKRVDFSARSVVSPDSNLALDELGVPEKVARALTIPEQITQWNYDKIVKMCAEGKIKYLLKPSPDKRRYEDVINLIKIHDQPSEIEKHLNYGMIVERCLQDGDYVLFNRQPTLHRMSMMGHRVRILPYNTFRLNLSVCTPYNADFDGDEMNMHVPQSFETISELKNIAHVPKQILAPKNNAPVMGIVQDALLGVYLFTMRDTFLTREEVMNLVIWIESKDDMELGDLPMPAILKPKPLWTGKQVMSMIIPKKITIEIWKDKADGFRNTRDVNMIIRKGELLSGALQKEVVGSGPGGLVHSIWLEIGPDATNQFITVAQRITNSWLMNSSFTVGACDIAPDKKLEEMIKHEETEIVKLYYERLNQYRNEAIIEKKNLHQRGKKVLDSFQFNINLSLNNQLNSAQKQVANAVSPYLNNIFKMITAKSKGSETNLTQIMFLLGNQNVDGKRCPQGFLRRALPHFPKDDHSPESRGFVFSSFYKGLKPHEFFFHSMGGREGLSDTAVKTSRTGYIQRKLVKSLEDLVVRYDGTVRDCNNNLLQKIYGQDGFAPEFIEKQRFPAVEFSEEEFKRKFGWDDAKLLQRYKYDSKKILKLGEELKELLRARIRLRQIFVYGKEETDIQYYMPVKIQRLIYKVKAVNETYGKDKLEDVVDPLFVYTQVQRTLDECVPARAQAEYRSLLLKLQNTEDLRETEKENLMRQKRQFEQDNGLELFRIHIRLFLASRSICEVYKLTKNCVIGLLEEIKSKFYQAQATPGEAIGSVAAQSVGEPTTQMTLNTFHLAGVSDKNVTLGVPRLQQLLDASKNIKTPNMTIFLKVPILFKNSAEKTSFLTSLISFVFPERHLKDYLTSSSIYYNPNMEARMAQFSDVSADKATPWVISLIFDMKKLTSKTAWNEILNRIEKTFEHKFQITEKYGFAESDDYPPELLLRRLNTGENKQEEDSNEMKELFKEEAALKNLFISGIKGMRTVKTSKKVLMKTPNHLALDKKQKELYEEIVFEAEGSNLRGCLSHPKIDSYRTYSNDINDIYSILGIEAARQAFINQFKQIIKPYGIYINYRHLSILADWISMRGFLTPVNRNGINRVRDVSVLRKASYEETAEILFGAAVFSEIDQLKGVSEKIIFGQNVAIGTCNFSIMIDREKVGNFKAKGKKDKEHETEENRSELLLNSQKNAQMSTPIINTPNPYNKGMLSTRSPSVYHSFSPTFTPNRYNAPQFTPLNDYNDRFGTTSHPSQTPLPFASAPNATPLHMQSASPAYLGVGAGSSYHTLYRGQTSTVRSPHYNFQRSNSPSYNSMRSESPDYNMSMGSSRHSNSPSYTPLPVESNQYKNEEDNDEDEDDE